MDLSGFAHVAIHRIIERGEADMFGRFFDLTECFKIQAEIKVGVTEMICLSLGDETVSIRLRCLENPFSTSCVFTVWWRSNCAFPFSCASAL